MPIKRVERTSDGVRLHTQAQEVEEFDGVVIATHADQVLPLLASPTLAEKTFGAWIYMGNRTVLHTDETMLPPNRRAWASWNYRQEMGDRASMSLTYDMNRLQGLRTQKH